MSPRPPAERTSETADAPESKSLLGQLLLWSFGILATLGVAAMLLVGVALAMIYPQLPDISDLADYRPKLSMRVFSVEGTQIGEFGEERRNFTPFKDIPQVMKNAVLAIEDARFYQHGGVDYIGLLRASLANLGRAKSQGASTITMQVARNVYLSSEKTFTRKIYEILLTTKLEHMGMPYCSVGVKIAFDPEQAYPKFLFSGVRTLTDDEADIILELRDSPQVKRIISEDSGSAPVTPQVTHDDGLSKLAAPSAKFEQASAPAPATPAPAAKKAAPKKAAAPAPVEAPVEDEEQTTGTSLDDELDALLG